MKGLTVKQENFCNYYLEEKGNATAAYRRAYSCDGWKDESVWAKASALLADDKVQIRIRELQEEQKNKSNVTKEMVLEELYSIAFSNIASLHNTWIERKEFEKLTDREKAAIKNISTKVLKKNIGTSDAPEIVDVEYVKVELHDKLKAIELLNRMLGWNEPERVENSGGMRIVIGDE